MLVGCLKLQHAAAATSEVPGSGHGFGDNWSVDAGTSCVAGHFQLCERMEHDVLAGHAGRQEGPGSQAALPTVVWHSGNAFLDPSTWQFYVLKHPPDHPVKTGGWLCWLDVLQPKQGTCHKACNASVALSL